MKIIIPILLCSSFAFAGGSNDAPAEGFVDVTTVVPGLKVEMRYLKDWNFLGRPVKGYEANKCFLTKEAAEALAKVQKEVAGKGYSLLAFDCYRPQRSVDDFVAWAKDLGDQKMKKIFYPDEPKEKLFEREYIASRSGHSRGSTIDLTLVKPGDGPYREEPVDCRRQKNIAATGQLDMGTMYDCFDPASNTANESISKEARAHRTLLKETMEKHGFVNYPKEWWHFTLKGEPFKDRFFDFPVR